MDNVSNIPRFQNIHNPKNEVQIKLIISSIISMFWNATICQKRKIFAGKDIKNDNMAPVSDTALRSKLAQGPFFFCISGEAKRSDDAGKRHDHRA